jgi:hypothetical protein
MIAGVLMQHHCSHRVPPIPPVNLAGILSLPLIKGCPVVVPRPCGNTGKNFVKFFVKFFVKLCAVKAPKTPLCSALSY